MGQALGLISNTFFPSVSTNWEWARAVIGHKDLSEDLLERAVPSAGLQALLGRQGMHISWAVGRLVLSFTHSIVTCVSGCLGSTSGLHLHTGCSQDAVFTLKRLAFFGNVASMVECISETIVSS